MIDASTAQRIKDAADIVEVVSDYVHLVRKGANYMGLCPFHNERTPSFSVNRKRNFCYCFSCKKGGSPINFIMQKEGISYKEALLHLAKKYGIEVIEHEITDEERIRQSRRESLLIANEWAMKLMNRDLFETEDGRNIGLSYLNQRGITLEAIQAFHLGYALDKSTHLVEAAQKAGFDLEIFKSLGLIGSSQNFNLYDRFKGRVIFPILNNSGKIIAFGGRDLKGGLAKYINSPESELYKKSNELYGIFQARQSIVKENKCFLVEGYMDVIGMWQSGIRNVVASSGTALTDGQISMIHRLTDNITLIYDGDEAGIKASLRGIDMLLSHKMNVKVLLLPDGHDPDSFSRLLSNAEFGDYIKEHETDIIQYKIHALLNGIDKSSPQSRINVINSIAESISHIPDPISRDVYIQESAMRLNVTEEAIAKVVGNRRFELIQKWKQERERKNIDTDISPSPDQDGISAIDNNNKKLSTDLKPCDYLYRPLENTVIKYCLKYGYMFFCMAEDEEGSEVPMSILEFVLEELSSDEIFFSVPEYVKIINEMQSLKPRFDIELRNFVSSLEKDEREIRNKSIEDIRKSNLTIHEINKKEAKTEENIKNWREQKIKSYTREWASRILASHEDDVIRETVTDLLHEKHRLSNIYSKDPTNHSEEERLDILVPRAINVWKSEILNNRLKDLLKEFQEANINKDYEKEQILQKRLNSLMKLRRTVAKNIGDRTLDPRTNIKLS